MNSFSRKRKHLVSAILWRAKNNIGSINVNGKWSSMQRFYPKRCIDDHLHWSFTVLTDIHPFMHTFTHRRRSHPRRATCLAQGSREEPVIEPATLRLPDNSALPPELTLRVRVRACVCVCVCVCVRAAMTAGRMISSTVIASFLLLSHFSRCFHPELLDWPVISDAGHQGAGLGAGVLAQRSLQTFECCHPVSADW